LDGRRAVKVVDGLKNCSSAAGATEGPRIWPAATAPPTGDEDGFFYLQGLPLSPRPL
jgi:hypothetical protein